MYLAGRPVDETAPPLERALAQAGPRPENWITRTVLMLTLVACESFDAVEAALGPMFAEAHRSGSASGLVNTSTILGWLKLRLGALPEADAAARVAERVAREGDIGPGLRRPSWPRSRSRQASSRRPKRCWRSCRSRDGRRA
jgi:hypothetical protein